MSPAMRSGEELPPPVAALASARSAPPSRPGSKGRAFPSSANTSATASAARCTKTRKSPTMAPPTQAPCSGPAWSSRSSPWSTSVSGAPSATPTTGPSAPSTAASPPTSSTPSPSQTAKPKSSRCLSAPIIPSLRGGGRQRGGGEGPAAAGGNLWLRQTAVAQRFGSPAKPSEAPQAGGGGVSPTSVRGGGAQLASLGSGSV